MRRLTTIVLLVLGAVLLPLTGAAAQDSAPAAWEVLPTPDDSGPRQAFELKLDPGQRHADAVVVRNRGHEPITVDVWATDAVTTPTGDLGLLLAEQAPRFAGAWITPETSRVTIAGRDEVTVPFTVAVPSNEQPGDYVAGVVVSMPREETTASGDRVLVEARVASRVYLRVPGELAPALALTDVTVVREAPWWKFWDGEARVDYTVTNTGNARLEPQTTITLEGPGERSIGGSAAVALPELMPGDSLRATTLTSPEVADSLVVSPVAAWGLIDAEVSVLARLSVGPEAIRETVEVSVVAVPWVPAGLVLLLLALLASRVTRAVRRRRTARRAAPPAGDPPPTTPTEVTRASAAALDGAVP